MNKLTPEQVRLWIESLCGSEMNDDNGSFGRHVSPAAAWCTFGLAGVSYVPHYALPASLKSNDNLRKFRSFLDEVVRVLDSEGVKPFEEVAV